MVNGLRYGMFLTPEQLRELTGYQLAAYQIRWLQSRGVTHWVRADGKPVVPVGARVGAEGAQVAQPMSQMQSTSTAAFSTKSMRLVPR